MSFDSRLSVTEGLDHVATRLDSIIAAKLSAQLGELPWTAILDQLDDIAGRRPVIRSRTDLQAQLMMLTLRLGQLGYPFDDHRRTASTLGSELRIVRNSWAHGDPFTKLDAWRAHDYCVRLLEYFDDGQGLIKSNDLRQHALLAFVDEQGIAPTPVAAVIPLESGLGESPDQGVGSPDKDQDPEVVTPDPTVFVREPTGLAPLIGEKRLSFEAWKPVPVGDVSVLNDLPKLAAKQKVRAVAAEIVEAEGPIHVDRLAQLVAASFGVLKLHAARSVKIAYQVKAAGMVIDKAKFVWPHGVDPNTWIEFRPNPSQVDRPFLQVSPVEVANAMRFHQELKPGLIDAELDTATLRTFGRRRRTELFMAHLARARALL